MAHLKITADKIFDGFDFLQQTVLVVSDEGTIADIVAVADAGDDVVFYSGLITPGFINCHCHLELSHMKGRMPEKTGLVDFVFKVVTERGGDEANILAAIDDAEADMKANGIVAVGDICNNTATLAQKRKRHLHYYNFIEASGWLPQVAAIRFKRAREILEAFRSINFAGAYNTIVPHAPYSVSKALWQAMQLGFANSVVSMHNQETAAENEFFRNGTGDLQRMYALMGIDTSLHQPSGKSSLQTNFHYLGGAKKIILVHNTFTQQQDIDFINALSTETTEDHPQTFFCLCVNANKYIEDTLPPVELFRQNNCIMVLGTDSLASNKSLDILDEIKTVRHYFPQVSMQEVLQWATSNGARALNMQATLGSFKKGKKPGVILIDEDELAVKKIIFNA